MEEIPDDVWIIILTDVVSKRHHVPSVKPFERDTRISYYSCRLISKKFHDLVTSKVPIYVLPVRMSYRKSEPKICTVFKNVVYILPVSVSCSIESSIPLNPNTKVISSGFGHTAFPILTELQILKMINETGDYQLIELLLLIIDFNPFKGSVLCHSVIMYGFHTDILRSLLSHPKIDIHQHGNLLKTAYHLKSKSMVKVLFEERKMNQGRTVVYPDNIANSEDVIIECANYCIETGDLELLQILLETHADLTIKHNMIIRSACCYAKIELIKLLLTDPDIDINSSYPAGPSARILAKFHQRSEVVKLLNEPRTGTRTSRRSYLAKIKK